MAMRKNWVDMLLEASEDEVDDVIDKAINSNDAQGIEDVNLADTEILGSDASTDPYALVYDKTDCYSQGDGFGDENIAGTVDVDLGDTETSVARGNETKAATESTQFTADEIRTLYSEAVSEVLAESTEEINAKYKEKVAAAKAWKAKALAREKAAAKKAKAKAVEESASVNDMIDNIFSRY